jgi:ferritin-like metal-binding protein YciE
MGELDGTWNVRRVSGFLPPLLGVQKRIVGGRGETRVPPLPGVPFRVVGLSLHYTGALEGIVDFLERHGDGYRGRTKFRGREIGTFAMTRLVTQTTERGANGVESQLRDQLTKHIDEAIAMEENVKRMLDGMISTTDDPQIVDLLEHHKEETERHSQRLRERLEAHGASPSAVREAGGILGALAKSVLDIARTEKAGRNARDGFATEHMEIASYELLERIAQRAGDEETAEVARQNRADEQAMARKLAENWDRFVELSLKEEGVTV